MAKPEAATQKLITDWLTWERLWWIRMNTGAVMAQHNGKTRRVQFGKAGTADILASSRESIPRPTWIEVKAPDGRQSPAQKAFQAEVEAAGHVYLLARCLEDVTAWEGWRR